MNDYILYTVQQIKACTNKKMAYCMFSCNLSTSQGYPATVLKTILKRTIKTTKKIFIYSKQQQDSEIPFTLLQCTQQKCIEKHVVDKFLKFLFRSVGNLFFGIFFISKQKVSAIKHTIYITKQPKFTISMDVSKKYVKMIMLLLNTYRTII